MPEKLHGEVMNAEELTSRLRAKVAAIMTQLLSTGVMPARTETPAEKSDFVVTLAALARLGKEAEVFMERSGMGVIALPDSDSGDPPVFVPGPPAGVMM